MCKKFENLSEVVVEQDFKNEEKDSLERNDPISHLQNHVKILIFSDNCTNLRLRMPVLEKVKHFQVSCWVGIGQALDFARSSIAQGIIFFGSISTAEWCS